jgi:hypothetical protein
MKAYEGEEVKLNLLLTLALDGPYHHAPAVLTPWTVSPLPIEYEAGWI